MQGLKAKPASDRGVEFAFLPKVELKLPSKTEPLQAARDGRRMVLRAASPKHAEGFSEEARNVSSTCTDNRGFTWIQHVSDLGLPARNFHSKLGPSRCHAESHVHFPGSVSERLCTSRPPGADRRHQPTCHLEDRCVALLGQEPPVTSSCIYSCNLCVK